MPLNRKFLTAVLVGVSLLGNAWANEQALCDSENLLESVSFDSPESLVGWSAVQHARGGSFAVEAKEGVLSISKVGPEPWFIYRQRLAGNTAAGKKVRFSALLKFDVKDPSPPHGFGYGAGLFFEVRNTRRRKVLTSSMDHEPNFGVVDWTPIALEFDLPEDTRDLSAGFIHKAGGSLSVRKASLVIVGDAPCAEGPVAAVSGDAGKGVPPGA